VAVWLLTNESPFWPGPPLQASQVTVLGASAASQARPGRVRSLSLADVRRLGAAAASRQALDGISSSASVLVHLDIDVFAHHEVPAAYFPHVEGLALAEGAALLGPILRDPRIRLIELAEYASLRDHDRRGVGTLVNLLADALKS
jgi:arginase family enzyme